MPKPCLTCGELTEASRCDSCAREHEAPLRRARERGRERLSPQARGYDAAWRRLSKRARSMQAYCSDCGTTEDLQTDHTPSAWQRQSEGKPIRLADVDVVCGPCNVARGSARPGSERARAA